MDLETMKQLIRNKNVINERAITKAQVAERYYHQKNDIVTGGKHKIKATDAERLHVGGQSIDDPLRTADNRVPSNLYNVLVNQKAAYMFTVPPQFDTGNEAANEKIVETLGEQWPKACKQLCVDASNGGVAWLHYWKDITGGFRYVVIKGPEVKAVFEDKFSQRLLMVYRTYLMTEPDGREYDVYEYWDDKRCYAYRKPTKSSGSELEAYNLFRTLSVNGSVTAESNVYTHGMGRVPFIPFFNGNSEGTDLEMVKDLIDAYDKVYNGFLNDLEDVQEVIYVLKGYGGQDPAEFRNNLKYAKMVKIDSDEDGSGGLSTLSIEIPVEARKEMLAITRKSIFEQGMGIDPDPSNFGNSSGVALKYLYSLLELKAGMMETEFRLGFSELVRAICRVEGIAEPEHVSQTWTRTSVSNDTEQAQIAQQSVGIISEKTIVKNHPWVHDATAELEQLAAEKAEKQAAYPQLFAQQTQDDAEDEAKDEPESDEAEDEPVDDNGEEANG